MTALCCGCLREEARVGSSAVMLCRPVKEKRCDDCAPHSRKEKNLERSDAAHLLTRFAVAK